MDEQPTFGLKELFTFVIGDMAKAMCERKGESREQQFARSEAAVHMIMGFLPRDAVEVLLAGHCVMLHEVMTAAVHDGLCGDAVTNTRSVVVLNKAFNDNLDRLERYRQRPAEGARDAPEPPPVTDAPAAPVESAARPVSAGPNRAARRQAARAETRAAAAARAGSRQTGPVPPCAPRNASPQAAHHPESTNFHQPAREAVATCRANPAAITALAAGDPDRFARALGIDRPSAAFLAAAKSPGSPFDPQATGPWPTDEAAATRKR
jgi:hypothetical protein